MRPDPDLGKRLTLHVDGASRGNPGPSSFGAILLDESDRVLEELSGFLGRATNNVAEYQGLLAGLAKALEHSPDHLTVKSDSQLLTNQLLLKYRVKDPKLIPLFDRAKTLLKQFPQVEILHIPREENRPADVLANNALEREASRGEPSGR
jgi:ribonuclease HI